MFDMLKLPFLGRSRARSTATTQPRIRQAFQPNGRKEPTAPMRAIAIVEDPAPESDNAPAAPFDDHSHVAIASEKDLPKWRGILADVVRDPETCIVLDLEYRSVMVLGTPEHFGSSAHSALQSTLRTRNLSVQEEKTTTREVIATLRAAAERKLQAQVGSRVSPDESNVQLYKDLLSGAMNLGASDIHILLDQDSNRSKVRVRIDGRSRDWRTFDTPVLNNALGAGYLSLSIRGTNSNSDWTLDRPINTITQFNDGIRLLNGRLSTQPCTGGSKVVIRISDGSSTAIATHTLADSGYTHEQIHEQILPALRKEKGFVLVGGSTGSGKTTTLQRMIMAIPGREWKEICAIEDPNEARIPGVAHHSIQRNTDDAPEKVKVMFDSAFMTQMRMDPDVIVIGEIRDRTSADLATDAVLTGHLLAVTMHGNSAIGQLFRLMNERIGMSPEVLGDEENFVLSMAQVLVPTLCEHCKVPAADVMQDQDLAIFRKKWQLDTSKVFCANLKGCEHCTPKGIQGNGEKGRTAAAEIITRPTPEFLRCLSQRDRAGAERAWRQTRRAAFDHPDMQGKTSFESALYFLAHGQVSPLTLVDVFGKQLDEMAEMTVVASAEILHMPTERAA